MILWQSAPDDILLFVSTTDAELPGVVGEGVVSSSSQGYHTAAAGVPADSAAAGCCPAGSHTSLLPHSPETCQGTQQTGTGEGLLLSLPHACFIAPGNL